MGIFDGVLLCTDLDGTFALGKDINEADIKAVNYFMDNGGLFTLCTGRVIYYLSDIFEKVIPNTFVISLNGAVISDTNGENLIKKSFLTSDYKKSLNTVLEYKSGIKEFFVYYENCIESTRFSLSDYLNKKQQIDNKLNIHKIVFSFNDELLAEQAEKAANELKNGIFCTRSWPTGVELLNKNSTKGEAVKFLKEKVNAKLLVCAGDYENDIPMIKEADIGYAVGNAHPKLIKAADRVTVPRSENAIAHVIAELENTVKNL